MSTSPQDSFKVRQATLPDVQRVFTLLKVMHGEVGIFPLAEEKAVARIASIIEAGGCLVIEDGGEMVASVGLEQNAAWYTEAQCYADVWFYVHHDHRKSGHAKVLLWFSKQASRMKQIPVVVSVGTTKDTLRKLRFFRKYMTPFGGSFIYGVQ